MSFRPEITPIVLRRFVICALETMAHVQLRVLGPCVSPMERSVESTGDANIVLATSRTTDVKAPVLSRAFGMGHGIH